MSRDTLKAEIDAYVNAKALGSSPIDQAHVDEALKGGLQPPLTRLIGLVTGKEVLLADIVEQLEPTLTSRDQTVRALGVELLAELLDNDACRAALLTPRSVPFVIEFLLSRLHDAGSVEQALRGMLRLGRSGHFDALLAMGPPMAGPDGESNTSSPVSMMAGYGVQLVPERLFAELDVQALPQPVRLAALQLIALLVETPRYAQSIAQSGNDAFVHGVSQAIDGEKDPRCLVVIFGLIPELAARFRLDAFAEDLFEEIFCYFPITFRTPLDNPSGITAPQLRAGLAACLCATPLFAPFALPSLLEKLQAASPVAQRDALEVLERALGVYGAEDVISQALPLLDGLLGVLSAAAASADGGGEAEAAARVVRVLLGVTAQATDYRDAQRAIERCVSFCTARVDSLGSLDATNLPTLVRQLAAASDQASVALANALVVPLAQRLQSLGQSSNESPAVELGNPAVGNVAFQRGLELCVAALEGSAHLYGSTVGVVRQPVVDLEAEECDHPLSLALKDLKAAFMKGLHRGGAPANCASVAGLAALVASRQLFSDESEQAEVLGQLLAASLGDCDSPEGRRAAVESLAVVGQSRPDWFSAVCGPRLRKELTAAGNPLVLETLCACAKPSPALAAMGLDLLGECDLTNSEILCAVASIARGRQSDGCDDAAGRMLNTLLTVASQCSDTTALAAAVAMLTRALNLEAQRTVLGRLVASGGVAGGFAAQPLVLAVVAGNAARPVLESTVGLSTEALLGLDGGADATRSEAAAALAGIAAAALSPAAVAAAQLLPRKMAWVVRGLLRSGDADAVERGLALLDQLVTQLAELTSSDRADEAADLAELALREFPFPLDQSPTRVTLATDVPLVKALVLPVRPSDHIVAAAFHTAAERLRSVHVPAVAAAQRGFYVLWAQLLQTVPATVVIAQLGDALVPLLVKGIAHLLSGSSGPATVIVQLLGAVLLRDADLPPEHLEAAVSALVAATRPAAPAIVRRDALALLAGIAARPSPSVRLLSLRSAVLRDTRSALDDCKRAVRAQAVLCQGRWLALSP